ncbi:hypothetical protein TURU_023327 [Turdus rufiventris]|nr:hypothetical protein TURU_023327 [Turdus rufiventris]
MSRQQKANAHGQPREWQPLLHKRYGPAAGQSHRLPPVQPTRGVQMGTGTQPAWNPLGHSVTVEFFKVQGGQGSATGSDVFRELGPHLRESRPVTSTWRTSKWLGARPKWEGIGLPSQRAARRQGRDTEDREAVMRRLSKIRQEQVELEDRFYDFMFKATISTVENIETPSSSRCIRQDTPRPTPEAAAGPSKRRSTKDAAAKTREYPELVSFDQLLAELGPPADDSLSCDAIVNEILEDWDKEELPAREAAAGQRVREPQSALVLPQQPREGCALRQGSSVTPQLAAGSQGPHSTSGVTGDSAGEAENNAEMAPPDPSPASGDSSSCDALLNELLEQWEKEELQVTAEAGERDVKTASVLSLPSQGEEEEVAASPTDGSPCDEAHSEALPTPLPKEVKMFEVPASPADATEEADATDKQAGCAQTSPPQEEPCGEAVPAGACPVPAQALPHIVPAGPAGSPAVPQPPAPRPWRSVAKRARRALRRLLFFSCLRGQPEE